MTKENIKSIIISQTACYTIRQDVVTVGAVEEVHEVLVSPEGVLVLPVTGTGEIILTREFRHNHGWVYGVPMGRRENQDEDPAASARRELQEEVGLEAKKWKLISTHHNGIHEEGLNYYYVAEELSEVEEKNDVDEHIQKIQVSFVEAFRLMEEGLIVDLPSRGCIWAGYIYLQQQESV